MKTFKSKQSSSALVNRLAGLILGLTVGAIATKENILVGSIIMLVVIGLVVYFTGKETKVVIKDGEIQFVNVDGAPKGPIPWERIRKIEREWKMGFQFHPRGHATQNAPHWEYNIETMDDDPIVIYDNYGEGLDQILKSTCNTKGITYETKPIV